MSKQSPLVSVIMNCHNGSKYLEQALDSLDLQTYKKWELIFFDNCSNDKSKEIIKNKKNKKIKYFFSKKKLKLYNARNLAIKNAKGKYITFLDTDDRWHKDKLMKQVNFFRKNKEYKIVYSNLYIIYGNKKNKKVWLKKKLPNGKILQNLLNEYVIGILTVMIKKEIFHTRKFNSTFDIIGDFDLFIQLSKKYMIGSIQAPLGYYRIHSGNYSKKYGLYLKEYNNWLSQNEQKLIKKGYNLSKIKFFIFKLKVKKLLSWIGFY